MQGAVTTARLPADQETLITFASPDRLPARIALPDAAPGGRTVDLSRDHAVIRTPETDASPVVMVAIGLFRGIAVTVADGPDGPLFRLDLLHADGKLTVPLAVGTSLDAVAGEWQAWARLFGLPMLAVDQDGTVHGALQAFGTFLAAPPKPRRRGSNLVGRRSRLSRRRAVPARAPARVFRGERELIAPE